MQHYCFSKKHNFSVGRFVDPLVYGHYPENMVKIVKDRLPSFTTEEQKLVKGSFDFIGLNYYTTRYARGIPVDMYASPVSFSDDQYVIKTGKNPL